MDRYLNQSDSELEDYSKLLPSHSQLTANLHDGGRLEEDLDHGDVLDVGVVGRVRRDKNVALFYYHNFNKKARPFIRLKINLRISKTVKLLGKIAH